MAATASIPGDQLRPALRRREVNAIIRICEPLAWKATDGLYIPGQDRDDLLQAARIGIVKAIDDFNGDFTDVGHFIAFAQLCARRQVLTEVKLAHASKRILNITADRLDAPVTTQQDADQLGDTIAAAGPTPHDLLAIKEELLELAARAALLTETERNGLALVVNGTPYKGDKRTDNAIQRARRKMREATTPTSQAGVLLVCRNLHRTRRAAISAAASVHPGCHVLDCQPRKVRGGRIVAPQGRSAADGTLGRPVWALTIQTSAAHDNRPREPAP